MMLSLKPHGRNDYLVLAGGQMVGQIFRFIGMREDPWKWALDSAFEDGRDGPYSGYAMTRDAAQVAFRQAWERLKPLNLAARLRRSQCFDLDQKLVPLRRLCPRYSDMPEIGFHRLVVFDRC